MRIESIQTDETIRAEIGARAESVRLRNNLTQNELALRASVSRATVERLESGESVQLTSLIRILRSLELVEGFNSLLPEPVQSPMELLKLQGRKRRRASGERRQKSPTDDWKWGKGK